MNFVYIQITFLLIPKHLTGTVRSQGKCLYRVRSFLAKITFLLFQKIFKIILYYMDVGQIVENYGNTLNFSYVAYIHTLNSDV